MIVAGIASMPERTEYLENTVEALRPQVDALRVYLNNFNEVPRFLRSDEGVISSRALGDLGDSGKFYWFERTNELDHSHYLTMDDDLGYPSDYVSRLVDEFDARDGKAIVGVHGSTFQSTISDFVDSRDERFPFNSGQAVPRSVHLLGTATTILSQRTLDLGLVDFSRLRNAADLHLGIAAQKQNVPMVVIARPENWITEERSWAEEGFSIWKDTKDAGRHAPQTLLATTAINSWRLFDDPIASHSREVIDISSV